MASPAGKPGAAPIKAKAVVTPKVNAATGRTMAKPVAVAKPVAAKAPTVAQKTATRAAVNAAGPGGAIVNKATGFTVGHAVQTPRASGYTPAPPKPSPLTGAGAFIQSHLDQMTGKQPSNISDALHGGMDRSTNAFGIPRPKK